MRWLLYLLAALFVWFLVSSVRAASKLQKEAGDHDLDIDVDDPNVVDELLRDADEGEDFETRQSAIFCLGKSKDPRAVPKLIELLEPPEDSDDPKGDDELRSVAVSALQEAADPAALEPLMRVLHDSELFPDAAIALAKIDGSFAALVDRLEDPQLKERVAAVRGLAAVPGEQALEPLRRALDDRSQKVRQEAATAYGWVLGKLEGDALLDEAARFLESPDGAIRAAVIKGLSQRMDAARLSIVRKALGDDHLGVRLAAVHCLSRAPRGREMLKAGYTEEEYLDAVETALRDAEAQVRSSALGTLRYDRSARAGEMVRRALKDDDVAVRSTAAWAAGTQRYEPSHGDLIDATRDSDDRVSVSAIRALGELGAAEAMDTLVQLVESPETDLRVRAHAVEAVGRIWSKDPKASRAAVPMLMEMLEHEEPSLRQAADQAVNHR